MTINTRTKLNYLIFSTNNVQILAKKTSTESNGFAVEFLTYNNGSEVTYSITFRDKFLRDSLFDKLLSPQNIYAKEFVADIYNKFLKAHNVPSIDNINKLSVSSGTDNK